MNIVLRPVVADDSDTIFAWQLAPQTRAFSRDPEPPTRDRHDKWMARRLAWEDAPYMIVLADGQPAGMLRLDPVDRGGFEISILVAPELYGRGIGKATLKLARALRPAADLYAEVLPGNTASDALFRSAGYVSTDGQNFTNHGAAETIVALHADGGRDVGLGHARRCAGLAHGLWGAGFRPMFFVFSGSGLVEFFEAEGFDVRLCDDTPENLIAMITGARALIVDSYRVDRKALAARAAGRVMLIEFDDTGAPHAGFDLVINGSPAATRLDYGKTDANKLLLGPTYQIVRADLVREPTDQRKNPGRMLVTIGGSDPLGISAELIEMLETRVAPRHPELRIDFVIGPATKMPKTMCEHIHLLQDPENMAALVSGADIAVSGGGQTLFELMYCGAPTLALKIADNQSANLDVLMDAGAIVVSGQAGEDGWLATLEDNIEMILESSDRRCALAETGMNMVDHQGADRIAASIAERIKMGDAGEIHP